MTYIRDAQGAGMAGEKQARALPKEDEMNNDKVYIVTKGEYSDYHIMAAFANKSTAEEFAKKATGPYDEARVETYDLRGDMPKQITRYFVEVDSDGNVVQKSTWKQWDFEREKEKGTAVYRDHHGLHCWASSYRGYDVATKAARDKLAQWKARKAGI